MILTKTFFILLHSTIHNSFNDSIMDNDSKSDDGDYVIAKMESYNFSY